MIASLRKIDELTEDDHYHIDASSGCFYFLEYPSGNESTNRSNPVYSYIHNLKKKPDRKGKPEWRYKEQAIDETIELFHAFFERRGRIGMYTLIPIPPSKVRNDPMYDDRMERVLSGLAQKNTRCDYRNLLYNAENLTASHEACVRPTINEIKQNYRIHANLIPSIRKNVLLIDDVLTTGAHFCAARDKILEIVPNSIVKGIFIARRALPDPALDYEF